jgi:hypothetical protein
MAAPDPLARDDQRTGPEFSPAAVQAVLAAAGFAGYDPGQADGFTVTDLRKRTGAILVGYRLAGGSTGGTAHAVRTRSYYTVALRVAGYLADIEGPCVVISADAAR